MKGILIMPFHQPRQEQLEKDLIEYAPEPWKFNFIGKNYSLKVEDFIPALSGSIGKVALVAAFAIAWQLGFEIVDPTFVTENVRLEIFIASVLTILFSSILNPTSGPPGTLAPLVPLIPVMITSGVHPLPLSILIGVLGLILCLTKSFSKLVTLNGAGTKGGILLLFGLLGITGSLDSLRKFTTQSNAPALFYVLIMAGLFLYLLLSRAKLKWMTIPLTVLLSILISAIFGIFPTLKTPMGLPILDPFLWWNEKWGIGMGLTVQNFVRAFPFALLAIVMWPIDALAIQTIQEDSYPKEAKKAIFDMNATYLVVSLRNILGAMMGGSQIAAIWRSFMIPLAIVKRPIGGSALILGVVGISFGLLGFPIDIAIFPPLLWMVLILGVFIPLVEVGLSSIKTPISAQIAAICVIAGLAVNPVIGWVFSIFVENFNVLKDKSVRTLSKNDKIITLALVAITVIAFILTLEESWGLL
jgi:hypothetical protein